MPRHDAISKEMIRAFLPDFLHLTAPDLAGRLDVSRARFLDKELFTEVGGGERREVDLLVQVPFLGVRKDLLIHVEVEARARSGMSHRLWSYRNAIQVRHRCQVLTIVVYLRRGKPGVHVLPFDGDPLDPSLPDSRYVSFGLEGCPAAEYLARPEPLAWAFAALMDPGPRSRAEHKLACLRRVTDAGLDEARTFLLVNYIETYVQLSPEEAKEFGSLGVRRSGRRVHTMPVTWAEKIEAKGRKEGFQEGIKRGVKEEREKSLRTLRRALLRQLEDRFGPLPAGVQDRVTEIPSVPRLVRLMEKALRARSLEELKLQ